MDDAQARRAARQEGLRVKGTVGLLQEGPRAGNGPTVSLMSRSQDPSGCLVSTGILEKRM